MLPAVITLVYDGRVFHGGSLASVEPTLGFASIAVTLTMTLGQKPYRAPA